MRIPDMLRKRIHSIIQKDEKDDQTTAIIIKHNDDIYNLKIKIIKDTAFSPLAVAENHDAYIHEVCLRSINRILLPTSTHRTFEIDFNYERTLTFKLKLSVVRVYPSQIINAEPTFEKRDANLLKEKLLKKKIKDMRRIVGIIKEQGKISLTDLSHYSRFIPAKERRNYINKLIFQNIIQETQEGQSKKKMRFYSVINPDAEIKDPDEYIFNDISGIEKTSVENTSSDMPENDLQYASEPPYGVQIEKTDTSAPKEKIPPEIIGKNPEIVQKLLQSFKTNVEPKIIKFLTNPQFSNTLYYVRTKVSDDTNGENIVLRSNKSFGNHISSTIIHSAQFTGDVIHDFDIPEEKLYIEIEIVDNNNQITPEKYDEIQNFMEGTK
jgi:hypothetical protein